jgi:hypothetical protein
MNKYMIIILIHVLAASIAFAEDAPTCKNGSDCEVVKVLTRCDVSKQELRNKIAKLERELKELKAQEKTVLVKETVKERVIEKTKIKKHIVSVIAHNDVQSISSTKDSTGPEYSAEAKVETGYVPAITYQYQFDMGLTPLIGVDVKKDPKLIIGLGYEF